MKINEVMENNFNYWHQFVVPIENTLSPSLIGSYDSTPVTALVRWNPRPGLLKWRTAVRIRTFGWWRPDLVSLSKVYSIPKVFIQNLSPLDVLLKHNSSLSV